jgi:transposase
MDFEGQDFCRDRLRKLDQGSSRHREAVEVSLHLPCIAYKPNALDVHSVARPSARRSQGRVGYSGPGPGLYRSMQLECRPILSKDWVDGTPFTRHLTELRLSSALDT